MSKRLFAFFVLFFIILSASAQKADSSADSKIVFFSDDVPRYSNFAVGVFANNQYGLGGWADYAPMSLGGGVDVEYTLGAFLPKNLDLGFALYANYAHIFPKSSSTLKKDDDISANFAVWLRVPFLFFGQRFALQPELGFGAVFHLAEGQNGSEASGMYSDPLLTFAPAVRWIPPAADTIEIELAPLYTFMPQKHGHMLNQIGFRLGLIWHIDSFVKNYSANKEKNKEKALAEQQRLEREKQEEEARRLKEKEEAQRRALEAAANEEEKARIEAELHKAEEARKAAEEEAARIAEQERLRAEEAARILAAEQARLAEIASWPAPLVSLLVQGNQNFTPDGDGLNDNVTFTPGVQYLEETCENWTILITDPQGHSFRTFKGNGALPETVVWDGKSDKGETVVSKNTYTAKLTVTPSRTDRLRTKKHSAETEVKVNTGLLLEEIVPDHEWKIVVQSIAFDPDAATFNKLTAEQVKANQETLDEVAQQIKDHPGANVVVEGYANNVSGTEKENREELIPLSQNRAESIVNELVNRGIGSEILTAKGMGGANPIAAKRDRENWWKNRRVEFRIVK